ncbi:MAG: helix-turn-helix transcriptional regulator, partial [Halobacteriota archaeon]
TVEYRFDVSDEERADAFEALVDGVRAGEIDPEIDRGTVEAYRQEAAASTGRSMTIEDARWVDRVEDDVGILGFAFTWTNFTARSGATVTVGDAFHSTDGRWLRTLDEGTRLTIDAPEGYELTSAPEVAQSDDGRLQWDGPLTLESGDLEVVYRDPSVDEGGTPWMLLAFFLVVLGVTGAMIAVGYRQSRLVHGGAEASQTADPLDEIDEELLSDAERVERLLRENGGRMKQASIVEATDWSNAKVSQLLSEMAEGERIQKLRIGQENLISLPEYTAE